MLDRDVRSSERCSDRLGIKVGQSLKSDGNELTIFYATRFHSLYEELVELETKIAFRRSAYRASVPGERRMPSYRRRRKHRAGDGNGGCSCHQRWHSSGGKTQLLGNQQAWRSLSAHVVGAVEPGRWSIGQDQDRLSPAGGSKTNNEDLEQQELVAPSNKNPRILWSLIANQQTYQAAVRFP